MAVCRQKVEQTFPGNRGLPSRTVSAAPTPHASLVAGEPDLKRCGPWKPPRRWMAAHKRLMGVQAEIPQSVQVELEALRSNLQTWRSVPQRMYDPREPNQGQWEEVRLEHQ